MIGILVTVVFLALAEPAFASEWRPLQEMTPAEVDFIQSSRMKGWLPSGTHYLNQQETRIYMWESDTLHVYISGKRIRTAEAELSSAEIGTKIKEIGPLIEALDKAIAANGFQKEAKSIFERIRQEFLVWPWENAMVDYSVSFEMGRHYSVDLAYIGARNAEAGFAIVDLFLDLQSRYPENARLTELLIMSIQKTLVAERAKPENAPTTEERKILAKLLLDMPPQQIYKNFYSMPNDLRAVLLIVAPEILAQLEETIEQQRKKESAAANDESVDQYSADQMRKFEQEFFYMWQNGDPDSMSPQELVRADEVMQNYLSFAAAYPETLNGLDVSIISRRGNRYMPHMRLLLPKLFTHKVLDFYESYLSSDYARMEDLPGIDDRRQAIRAMAEILFKEEKFSWVLSSSAASQIKWLEPELYQRLKTMKAIK